jgi:hypothetical protein
MFPLLTFHHSSQLLVSTPRLIPVDSLLKLKEQNPGDLGVDQSPLMTVGLERGEIARPDKGLQECKSKVAAKKQKFKGT